MLKLRVRSKKKSKKINPRKIHEEYLKRMDKEAEKLSVPLFDPANDNLDIDERFLVMPSDITNCGSRTVGKMLNAFTQQKMYLRTILWRVENLAEISKRVYFEKSAYAYSDYSNGRLSESAKERLICADDEIRPYYEDWVDCTQKLRMVQSAIANVEDAIFLISREVTRRGSDFDNENRAHNVTTRRR